MVRVPPRERAVRVRPRATGPVARCHRVRAAWIVELGWSGSMDEVTAAVEGRRFPGKAHRPTWAATAGVPRVLSEGLGFEHLAPALRALLGEAGGSAGVRWYTLDDTARGRLLGHLRLAGGGEAVPEVEDVHVVVYPLGVAFCVFRVAWAGLRTLDDAVDVTFAARVARADRRSPGWTVSAPPPAGLSEAVREARLRAAAAFGPLAPALAGEPVTLHELVVWLVGPSLHPTRRDAVPHTSVVLAEEPTAAALGRAAWRLRRGYGRDYVTPPPDAEGPDRTLRPRGNRLVAVSRDGAVAIGWPADGDSLAFETDAWPARFVGVWLLLHLQVLSERATLASLSEAVPQHVRALAAAGSGDAARRARDDLARLVERMVHYSAAISTEDCGGLGDQVEFYGALRGVNGIGAQRAELRAEIGELFGLVEARHHQAEAQAHREADDERRRQADAAVEAERLELRARELDRAATQRLQDTATFLGLPLLIVSLVSGILGMNYRPGEPAFVWVTSVAVLLGVLVTAVALRHTRPRAEEVTERARIDEALSALRRPRG